MRTTLAELKSTVQTVEDRINKELDERYGDRVMRSKVFSPSGERTWAGYSMRIYKENYPISDYNSIRFEIGFGKKTEILNKLDSLLWEILFKIVEGEFDYLAK